MCRGGKDGIKKRCKASLGQKASAALRKQIKYHADKEGMSVEEWKTAYPETAIQFKKDHFPEPSDAPFQSISETRRLPEGIPMLLSENIEQNRRELEHFTPEERVALRGYAGFAAGIANTVLRAGTDKNYEYYDLADPWRETGGPCDFVSADDLQDYLETTDRLLEKRSENRRIVYRGNPIYTGLHDEIGASIGKKLTIDDTDGLVQGLKEYYKPGKVFAEETYVSTSHSAYAAADRTDNSIGTKETYWEKPEIRGIMFEIKTNAGVEITSVSNHASEREVLLPRETYFKVVNVEVKPKSYDTVSGYERRDPTRLNARNFTSLAAVVQMVEVDADGNEIMHTEPHKPVKPIAEIFAK